MFVVAELPRNAMGKVQKNLLREQHARLVQPDLMPGVGDRRLGAGTAIGRYVAEQKLAGRSAAAMPLRSAIMRSDALGDVLQVLDGHRLVENHRQREPRMPSSFEISLPMAPRKASHSRRH